MVHPIWRLSEAGADNLGLACNEEGLLLGRTPLIARQGGRFVVREPHDIQRLLSRAYRTEVDARPLMGGLAAVAAALNANDLLLARIAAVHLRIPDLPDEAARERLEAEDHLIKYASGRRTAKIGDSEWNPALHPRADAPPNPGWFAPRDGASGDDSSPTRVADNETPTRQADASSNADDDRVKLPPSDDDIDELHDLVEWIANAKPEDEAAIRAEIKKHFYDVGDTAGGDALNRALSDALEAGNNKKARQEILDNIAVFAKNDPAEIGFLREILALPGMVAEPRTGIGSAEEGAAAEAETGAAAAEAAAENPWKMGWAKRGDYFSEQLGANLPRTFKTIDRFENGVVTSIKSIDLNAATYQDGARLTYRLNDYIGKLASYTGSQMGYIKIESAEITGRELSIAIPKGSMTAIQREAVEAARIRARSLGIDLKVTEF
jgi:hypothetical protein